MAKLDFCPKSFTLFGTRWNVVFDNERMQDKGLYGLCEYSQTTITLSDKSDGIALSEGRIKDTFYHEKVHAILDAMDERELCGNEKFVDVFAKLLRQSEETAVFKKKD